MAKDVIPVDGTGPKRMIFGCILLGVIGFIPTVLLSYSIIMGTKNLIVGAIVFFLILGGFIALSIRTTKAIITGVIIDSDEGILTYPKNLLVRLPWIGLLFYSSKKIKIAEIKSIKRFVQEHGEAEFFTLGGNFGIATVSFYKFGHKPDEFEEKLNQALKALSA